MPARAVGAQPRVGIRAQRTSASTAAPSPKTTRTVSPGAAACPPGEARRTKEIFIPVPQTYRRPSRASGRRRCRRSRARPARENAVLGAPVETRPKRRRKRNSYHPGHLRCLVRPRRDRTASRTAAGLPAVSSMRGDEYEALRHTPPTRRAAGRSTCAMRSVAGPASRPRRRSRLGEACDLADRRRDLEMEIERLSPWSTGCRPICAGACPRCPGRSGRRASSPRRPPPRSRVRPRRRAPPRSSR